MEIFLKQGSEEAETASGPKTLQIPTVRCLRRKVEERRRPKLLADSSGAVKSVALAIGMLSWCLVELEKNLDRRRK
jgi:hypothetical protein